MTLDERKKYEAPEIEVVEFECEDVIRTSPEEGETPTTPTNQSSGFGFSGFNLY